MQHFLTKKPPINSKIEINNELNQTIIFWKNPQGSWSKYLVVIFLLAWLGGWAMGEYSVAKRVLNGVYNPFEIFWLIGWTVGGIFAVANIYFMVRPSRPERLIFDSKALQFKRGTPPFAGINWSRNRREDENAASWYQKVKNKYTIPKNEVGEIKLERIGEKQKLTLDHGAERI